MNKIAIIGATGMLGQPVTEAFVHAGFEVTIFARNINKATRAFGQSVRMVEGNLADTEKIKSLLTGQEGLYLNLSVEQASAESEFQPEREGLDNILHIAKQSGIRRIGYLSSLVHFYQGQNGFSWWVFDIKQKAIEKIKHSGIPYSIFYPSTFMESFDKGAYRQGSNLALAGTSKYKMYLIAGTDYGKQVVRAFQIDNGSHEYAIQGQEGFTADEAAKFYVEHYTKEKVRILKAPVGMLKFMGLFANKFSYGAKIVEALNNYPEKFESETTWAALGKPETRFIDYIRQSL
jgi:NAD(P)-dependent dehydrogenase (short-subunit alcohol dehydrogenase family)